LSYHFQLWAGIYLWLTIGVLLTTRWILTAKSRRRRQDGNHLAGGDSRLISYLEKLVDSNFTHATASIVADFHEAQCFFVAATSIAVIYAGQTGGAQFSGSEDWASLVLNENLASALGRQGIISVALTQLILVRLSMDSDYALLCSTLAVGLGLANSLRVREFDADGVHEIFGEEKKGLHECGGNPSLTTFCASRDGLAFAPLGGFLFNLGFAATAVAVLPICWCSKISQHNAMGDPSSFKSHFAGTLFTACPLALLIFTTTDTGYGSATSALWSNDGTWNVGQVIAVLLWVPLLAKYFYTLLCKRENTSNHCIKKHELTVQPINA
jgi:hypothetical protein